MKALMKEYVGVNEKVKQWNIAYILQHPKSYVSAFQLYDMQQSEVLKPSEISRIVDKLDPSLATARIIVKVRNS